VCLAGPTAAGKTELAVALARRFPVDVISVDSAMVYRGLDIGTAKPDSRVRAEVPHHLVDIRDPWESYSAGQFAADARGLIRTSLAAGRLPLLVGGTMLYFRALSRGLANLPAAAPAVRAQIDAAARSRGWPALHAELARVDPRTAARIASTDRQRIQRALEVYRVSGRTLSAWLELPSRPAGERLVAAALIPGDRAGLYRRIEARLATMLEAGFLDEVAWLHGLPRMHAERPAARAVGYRQFWAWLDGTLDLDEARRRALVATRRYAKRQLTWLRAERFDASFDCLDPRLAERVAEWLARRGEPDAM